MSEGLLFNGKWAHFQLYHGENKLYFDAKDDDDDDEVVCVLNQHAVLGFIVVVHWSNSP